MQTLYIERKEGVDLDQCLAECSHITKIRKNDEVYTINAEDKTFVVMSADGSDAELKQSCRRIHLEYGTLTMHSGLVDKTRIDGVVRKGNFLLYDGEEYILDTEIYDERCHISFPLITQRRMNRKIRFKPLNISLPTDLETIERHIDSLYVLEGGKKSKMDYTKQIITPIIIATAIYPRHLIWKFSRIPREIAMLLQEMKKRNTVPKKAFPAYFVMSETEMEHLELDLYIGDFLEMLEEHIRPIELLIPPTSQRPRSYIPSASQIQSGVADKIENAENLNDIGNISEEVRQIADQMLGNGNKTVSFRRGPRGVNIKFTKERED